MQFEYLYTTQATGFIDIEDIGNVCISAVNTFLFQEYILIVRTEYGKTKVIQYGPKFIDDDNTVVPSFVSCTYVEFDFNSGKIKGIIDKFLNNPKNGISQVTEIDLEDASRQIRNLVEFL